MKNRKVYIIEKEVREHSNTVFTEPQIRVTNTMIERWLNTP